ncbi:MAG: tripartite tricarboxylate transporter TctB family protein [Alphaproteobacteria bacterium]|nr:tripartite tricarboxylate transporter TctB family protein [Alphaproteobacteria bacterium]
MGNSRLHWPDLAAGIMLIAISVIGYILNLEHPMGTARRMGPGYLPFLTFLILVTLGTLLVIRGLRSGPTPIGKWAVKETLVILGALIVFGIIIERLGIIIAILVTVMIAGFAEAKYNPLRTAGGAVALVAICVGIFVWGLDIRLPLFPWSK